MGRWISREGDDIEMLLVKETYKAYCITPSFFSWLGNRTSRLGLPVTLRGGPSTLCDLWISVDDLAGEDDIYAD